VRDLVTIKQELEEYKYIHENIMTPIRYSPGVKNVYQYKNRLFALIDTHEEYHAMVVALLQIVAPEIFPNFEETEKILQNIESYNDLISTRMNGFNITLYSQNSTEHCTEEMWIGETHRINKCIGERRGKGKSYLELKDEAEKEIFNEFKHSQFYTNPDFVKTIYKLTTEETVALHNKRKREDPWRQE